MAPADASRGARPPRVSIIIPVFNGTDYLAAAIDSALAQDYPDTEVLVVNDGSSDDGATDRLARSYGTRIRYLTKPNGGVASALNAGLQAMTGEVFCWLSHDDIHLPHKTRRQVAEWERLGRPRAVLFTAYRLIDQAGKVIGQTGYDAALLAAKPRYALLRGCLNGCTMFIPRSIFDEVGGFDETLPTTQDYDLWNRMMGRVEFIYMPEFLIESRQHPAQGSRRMDHREEARALWLRMAAAVPVDEQVRLEGSSFRFLEATSRFLADNGMLEAAADLAQSARASLHQTCISVLLDPGPWPERTHASLDSVAAQCHPAWEVLLGGPPQPGLARRHPNARWHCRDGADAGWHAASGPYIALLEDGALMLPDRLERQLLALETADAAVCQAPAWQHQGAGHPLARTEAAGTILVRRAALEADAVAFPEAASLSERLARIAATCRVVALPDPLTILRQRPA